MLCGAGEEEEEETPEPREEPHCQKKYRAVCKLLRCRPIKHFLRSLITDYVAVKNQKLSNDDIKACVIGLLVRLNDKLQYQLCLWSVAALSACCTDLCVFFIQCMITGVCILCINTLGASETCCETASKSSVVWQTGEAWACLAAVQCV